MYPVVSSFINPLQHDRVVPLLLRSQGYKGNYRPRCSIIHLYEYTKCGYSAFCTINKPSSAQNKAHRRQCWELTVSNTDSVSKVQNLRRTHEIWTMISLSVTR